jgi:hypothetical protein
LVAVGVGLRIRQFAFRRSLWTDEASLAFNILQRGYGGLTRPLDVVQGAPIGFLWMEKTATELFGTSEYALRLVPLIAGIVSVVMFRDLANKVLPPLASGVALSLFAVSPALVYYSSEAKQYGVDVAVVVGLAWFLPWLLDGTLTTRKSLWWGAVAVVLVWCSFPAAFAAGGVSVVVVAVRFHRRQRFGLPVFVASSLYWVVSFAIEYMVSLRQLHSNGGLLGYWAFAFPPRPFGLGATLSWFGHDVRAVAAYPWDLAVFPLVATLLIVGLTMLLWRRPPLGILIAILAGVMVVAGIAHDYPLADRMVLFSLPFVCLALAATILVSRRAGIQLLFVGLVLVVSVPELGSAASATVHPYTKTEVREAYVYVQQHRRPGDALLIEWEGVTIFDYYNRTLGVNANGYFRSTGSSTSCDNGRQLAQLEQWKRVWLVFGIAPGSETGHPISSYVNAFRSVGLPTSTFLSPGPAGAVLLSVSSAPAPARVDIAAPSWQPASYGCLSVIVTPMGQ